jgi:RNA polymerase sigma factor (sigma-70 family)
MRTVIEQLRRSMRPQDEADLTDGQLLALFIERRDEAAFAALVRRHGSMVLGVCLRVARNRHDAEDAFQATFLVLVRKAASITSRELLANWLYGVAYNTALKARQATAKRWMREKQVREMPEPVKPESDTLSEDLRPLLDQELSRLPDKYRTPIVLCDLEGKTRKEAAQQLGCPEGSLSSRLARARTLLAKRLSRHGLLMPSGALAAVLAQSASSASVPTPVMTSTINTATLFAAGQGVAGVLPPQVAALTAGVLKAMMLTKLKTAMGVLLGVTLLLTAAGVLTSSGVGVGNTEQPVTATMKLEDGKNEVKESAWGEAVEDVQVRLRPAKVRPRAGEPLTFQLDLRNKGGKPFSAVRQPTFCEIEFDSQWYLYGGMAQVNSPASSVEPGQQINGWVNVVVDESWVRKTPGRVVGGALQAKGEEWLSLTPGKHTVRVACASTVGAVRPVSNEVELNIPKGKENNAWGKAVGGIQARLRPQKQRWQAGETPVFELDLRYEGEKPILYSPRLPIFCEVEVDGTWYGGNLDKPIRARISELQPGEQVNGWMAVSFDGPWRKGVTGGDRHQPGDQGQSIRLAPGKHAIRVAFAPGLGQPRPISNVVEIEVQQADDQRGLSDERKPPLGKARPALRAEISVNQALFRQEELEEPGALLIQFALVNDSDKAAATDVDSWRIIVNGQPMSERHTSLMFGNGSRMAATLAPGGHSQVAKAMGIYFQEPGTYKVSWTGKTFASPEITFRVLPRKKN